MESIILSPESLLLTDDFDFHVDVASDPDARVFLDLLTSMGLKQHLTITAHVSGHTLDLLITCEHVSVSSSVPVADRYLSDHATVLCPLKSSKPDRVVKKVSYRKVKSIDFDALRSDLETSELCTREYTNIRDMPLSYNSMRLSLFDNHAPLKTKTVVSRQIVPGSTVISRVLLRQGGRQRGNGEPRALSRTFWCLQGRSKPRYLSHELRALRLLYEPHC